MIVNYTNGEEENLGWVLNATGECRIIGHYEVHNARFAEDVDAIRDSIDDGVVYIFNMGEEFTYYTGELTYNFVFKQYGLYECTKRNNKITSANFVVEGTSGAKETALKIYNGEEYEETAVLIPKAISDIVHKINYATNQTEMNSITSSTQNSGEDVYVAVRAPMGVTVDGIGSVLTGKIVKLMYDLNGIYRSAQVLNETMPDIATDKNAYILVKTSSSGEISYDFVTDGKDGADGSSPTVTTSAIEGGNNIIFVDKNGMKSIKVMDGKSAYEYAKDGGFTGTETEFSDKLVTLTEADIATKSEGSFFIAGSGTTDSSAKTSTWVGTSDRITSYYDGLAIRYKIGVAGQNTTTLNINNLGAKTVYLFNTTKLTTQFPVNSIINLIYHEDLNSGCWVCSDYDSNTNTQQRVYETTTNTEYPITARYNTTTGSSYYAEYGRYSTGVTLNPSTNTITATAFKGSLTGNANTATKATQDASGNDIASTYTKKTELSSHNTDASAHADIREELSQLSSEKVDLTERIEELEEDVLSIQAQSLQQTPLFANSIEECTDTSKMYVLPDGYIYGYIKTTSEGESKPNFTNALSLNGAYVKNGYRYSNSSAAFCELLLEVACQ